MEKKYKKLYELKCQENKELLEKIEFLEKKIIELNNIKINKENNKINDTILEKIKLEKNKIEENNKLEINILKENKTQKGRECSISGNNYEKIIFGILQKCFLNNKIFNSQEEKELGGSTSKNDILCNFIEQKDIGIEIKKHNTPDWMQCSIKYNKELNKWYSSKKCIIPQECSQIFENLISNLDLYNGNIPPFLEKKLRYDEWINIKDENNNWNDIYIDIPEDTIKTLYNIKGCKYIQISDGYGLYHLGEDICKFNVPEFIIEQQLRIRIKVHSSKNKNGFCNLSVMASCQPKNIKSLIKSNYSLDNIKMLPENLKYIS